MHLGNRVWAPRALAVLSCALALLAAQPVLGETPRHAPSPLPLTAPSLSTQHLLPSPSSRLPQVRSTTVRPEATFFTSARRLHILATVEILKRLLLAELQPPVQPLLVPTILLEPMACMDLVATPLTLPGARSAPDYPSLPPPEHQFVLVHTQLAPPTV
jgi:hypothetical protein